MQTVSESRPNLVRQLNNGIVLRGQYARVPGKGNLIKVELFVTHPKAVGLWSESRLTFVGENPQDTLVGKLSELEAQLKDACIDQVPMEGRGPMLIRALIEAFARKRGAMSLVA